MTMTDKPYCPPTFVEYFEKVPPGVLFHYTGQGGLLGIIENAELWSTKIQYMNDSTEFSLALNLARQHLEAIIIATNHASEKSAAAMLHKSLEGIEDINIFAVCFCEGGDLLSQWRGYAGGRQGYALGFSVDVLMQSADGNGFTLGPCIYEQATQREIVREAVDHCIMDELSLTAERRWGFHGPLADILFRCGAFFKDPTFQDEKEWRLVSSTVLYSEEKIRFRPGNSMLMPYYALPVKNSDRHAIEFVVVGPCPHMELATSAVTSLLMRHGNDGPLYARQIALGSKIPFRNW